MFVYLTQVEQETEVVEVYDNEELKDLRDADFELEPLMRTILAQTTQSSDADCVGTYE